MDFVHHAAIELRRGPVNPRRIDKNNLRGRMLALPLWHFHHPVNPGARGLRFGRHDGDLLANERIQQRRLARVRTPDDGDEAGSHLPID